MGFREGDVLQNYQKMDSTSSGFAIQPRQITCTCELTRYKISRESLQGYSFSAPFVL
jgi:hypothetical protein